MKWRPASVKSLRALGRSDMPASVTADDGNQYDRIEVFKHDFFAATGLYRGPQGKAVLKMGRTADFLGLPMAWLGEWLTAHETALYRKLDHLPGVPKFIAPVGAAGLLHVFIEGHALQKREPVSDTFFDELTDLLTQIHDQHVAYVDMEKCGNILVGEDGRPYLVDFQISWHVPKRWGGRIGPAKWICTLLQASDRYHLLKHRRRTRPDQLSPEDLQRSYRPPFYIGIHRWITKPFTRLRRRTLQRMSRAEKARQAQA
jgi:hypothetical protein